MIEIKIAESGTVYQAVATIYCDRCGTGAEWEADKESEIPSVPDIKRYLRGEGWKFGKSHFCESCVTFRKNKTTTKNVSVRKPNGF